MKMKSLLLTIAAIVGITAITIAQNVPSYVPTDGLVGWWPFNGNANDESGNANNGAVNGATLSQDRFGNSDKSYEFNRNTIQTIDINNSNSLDSLTQITISFWFNIASYGIIGASGHNHFINKSDQNNQHQFIVANNFTGLYFYYGSNDNIFQTNVLPQLNQWHNLVITYAYDGSLENSWCRFYLNGLMVDSFQTTNVLNITNYDLRFGTFGTPDYNRVDGTMDDICIWNRAINQQEITYLFDGISCANNTLISPITNYLTTGSTSTFTASTSDPNPSFVWQSDFGQGFQNLNEFGNYSGTNTSTLNIANVQLSEHNQPIRVITTSGECVDTSDVATISILDTCVTSINDTTFITVTDTLLINTLITGINPPNNSNIIKVYPNPSNSHITIEYGDFAIMDGYQLRIENSLGQEVFQTSITQQSDYLSLTNWGGNGLYFVRIIDPQGNTIDIRKIVIQ